MTWLAHALRCAYIRHVILLVCVIVYIRIWLYGCLATQRAHIIKYYIYVHTFNMSMLCILTYSQFVLRTKAVLWQESHSKMFSMWSQCNYIICG